jgi:hypothetical protein
MDGERVKPAVVKPVDPRASCLVVAVTEINIKITVLSEPDETGR